MREKKLKKVSFSLSYVICSQKHHFSLGNFTFSSKKRIFSPGNTTFPLEISPSLPKGPVPFILHEFALHQVGSLLISSSACWDLRRGRVSAHATAQYKASIRLSSCWVSLSLATPSHSLVRREEKAPGSSVILLLWILVAAALTSSLWALGQADLRAR